MSPNLQLTPARMPYDGIADIQSAISHNKAKLSRLDNLTAVVCFLKVCDGNYTYLRRKAQDRTSIM
jgi:hypothetical protein